MIRFSYSRILVRHHWLVVGIVVLGAVILTTIGILFTDLPDFSDPRKGWGARGKGTIFSQLMVLRHASERFRLAYELPLETYELFEKIDQFSELNVEQVDENSYKKEFLDRFDLWRKPNRTEEFYDYQDLNETFYDVDREDFDEDSVYIWHRDRHFDLENRIIKFVDDKLINTTVVDLVQSLPRLDRLSFDLFRPYAFLIEEKYRGRAGRDGMIEFYIETRRTDDDLLTLSNLKSICRLEKKLKKIVSLENATSLSLSSFVALYASKSDCEELTMSDIERFREIIEQCFPFYAQGFMDLPLSDVFLNRVEIRHENDERTFQEQNKAVYSAVRHVCFYKNVTRFLFDNFLEKNFLENRSKIRLSLSMIFISNYRAKSVERRRDKSICLRRQPFSMKYCLSRGCLDDVRNGFLSSNCEKNASIDCSTYCRCRTQCPDEKETVVVLTPILKSGQLVRLSQNLHFPQDEPIRIVAFNFANVREQAAMARIYRDIFLVVLATILIIIITILYLRSVAVASIIVISAGFTLAVSYFIYRLVYRIPIFPFMNLMSAFILIGIACDDIFLFFDTWEKERNLWIRRNQTEVSLVESNKKIRPRTTEKCLDAFESSKSCSLSESENQNEEIELDEQALTEIMSETLKHAASSMFVTSFTTSAAFFSNILTNISFVQVFGVFTGTCILLYFLFTVTGIAGFAVIYEKNVRRIRCPKRKGLWKNFIVRCRSIRNRIFEKILPATILRFPSVFIVFFLLVAAIGFVGVFYYPKLRVPSTQKVTFFLKENPMEIYEFSMKNRFNGYVKEERRMFAYPMISFVFGIRNIDDGNVFDMSDRGTLHLTPIRLEQRETLEFFRVFIENLSTRPDLFSSNEDLKKDFQAFYQLTSDEILLARLIDEKSKFNASKTDRIEMIEFIRQLDETSIEKLVAETMESSKDSKFSTNFYRKTIRQLKKKPRPFVSPELDQINFNETLTKFYREKFEERLDVKEIKSKLNNTVRDQLNDEYQRSALKTAMQCLTGAAGENNIPVDFCLSQLNKQRSLNWAVLPDKPSPIDGTIRPFGVIISIRGTLNQTDYDSYNKYYFQVKEYFDPYIEKNAPEHLKSAWFSSGGFAFYGIQRELLVGSYTSLGASLVIALFVLFLTSGNFFIAIYALLTIIFAIAFSVGIFASLDWELGVVEAIIVIMSVGLSVDFVVHFGVAYIHANVDRRDSSRKTNRAEREQRVRESISRVGSAVFMAAFTTFLAGFSMSLSSLSSFRHMGQFLMTIMSVSWLFATFFFLSVCAVFGPVGHCGSIRFSRMFRRFRHKPIPQEENVE